MCYPNQLMTKLFKTHFLLAKDLGEKEVSRLSLLIKEEIQGNVEVLIVTQRDCQAGLLALRS